MSVVLARVEASADRLREVIGGRDHLLPRREAIARLGASEIADREPLLRAVLENREEHPLDRGIAAAGLAVVGTESALAAIARAASSAGAAVLTPAVQILGRSGGPDELRTFEAIARTPDVRLAAQARFAAALIAYRHRLDLPGLPPTNGELLEIGDPQTAAIELTGATREEMDMCRRSLHAERLAFEMAPDAAYRLQCRRRTMIVSPDARLLHPDGVQELLRKKALVAVVATRVEDGTRYSASHVVLADPTGGSSVTLRVCRMSGVVVLAGDAAVSNRAAFALRAIRRPGAVAVELTGSVGPDGLRIDRSRVARRVHETISPSPRGR